MLQVTAFFKLAFWLHCFPCCYSIQLPFEKGLLLVVGLLVGLVVLLLELDADHRKRLSVSAVLFLLPF